MTLTALFADTFYWIRLAEELLGQRQNSFLVTTDEVLAEISDLLLQGTARVARTTLLADPAVRVVPQSRESFRGGLDLYLAHPDKGYSLTDCKKASGRSSVSSYLAPLNWLIALVLLAETLARSAFGAIDSL